MDTFPREGTSFNNHPLILILWWILSLLIPLLLGTSTLIVAIGWLLAALWQGHTEVTVLLILVNSPHLAFFRNSHRQISPSLQQRLEKAQETKWQDIAEPPIETGRQQSVRVQQAGIAMDKETRVDWGRFSSFSVVDAEENYFRLYLHYPSQPYPPLSFSLRHTMKWLPRSIPTLLTTWVAWYGYRHFGWRADTIGAIYLALSNLLFLSISVVSFFPVVKMRKMVLPPLNLLMDRRIVSAEACLSFLETRLPRQEAPE
jgi:hypothetical protein